MIEEFQKDAQKVLEYYEKKKKHEKCEGDKLFHKINSLQKEINEYINIYREKNPHCATFPNHYLLKWILPETLDTQICNSFYFISHDFVRKKMAAIAKNNFKSVQA